MKKPTYRKVTLKIRESLEAIVGRENITTAIEDLVCYSRDASLYEYTPEVVVRPRSTEQVSQILKLANRERIPVTPRGGGSGATAAALPLLGGILLDMTAMNRILSISVEDQIVVVEPGVVYDFLNEKLMEQGFFFPPDPSSGITCTIGGMVNTNASGDRTLKYGSTRDYALWLEVVLPSGEIITTGSKTLKSVSDFDLTRLIVGSEGSLGVVTKVCLKIWPYPKSFATAVLIYDDINPLAHSAAMIRKAGIIPEMMEFMDEKTARLALEYAGITGVPDGNFMLIDIGGTEESTAKIMEGCLQICKQDNPIYLEQTGDKSYRDKLISARKSAFPSLARLRPSIMLEDCTLPLSKLPQAVTQIDEIPKRIGVEGLDLGDFGHIGDGNLHPTFVFDERVEDQRKAFHRALDMLYKDIVLPLGGSITAEHGVGLTKADFIELEHGPAVKWMRAIKELFDPNFIMNPGKGKGGPYPLEGFSA
ncbi:MAG: FAD-binding oxidoreductase [Candidatus Bathyarchaeia archaeon]